MIKQNEMIESIEILYSLKEKIRLIILGEIFVRGSTGLSFKEIVSLTGIGPTRAAYHLKVLLRGGMIDKRFRNQDGRRDYSFYHITELGDRVYMIARKIFEDIVLQEEDENLPEIPDIMITHLRHGPRCISIERITG